MISRCVLSLGAATALLGSLQPEAAEGQLRPEAVVTPQADAPPPLAISPGGAFWRALLVPGWGHAAIGSYGRAGFYVAAQSGTVYSLLRARMRIGEMQDRVSLREQLILARLAAEGITAPEEVDAQLEADQRLGELRLLLDSRKEQQEDLVALTLALVFISAADAYVSAHLARFPEPLDVGAEPSPSGGLDLSLRVKLPN